MKKHNCRMSQQEKDQHIRAVKIRKMTDAQICEILDREPQRDCSINEFLDKVQIAGVGKVTIKKLKEAANQMGY